jgi:hypothetical protein
LSSWMRGDTSPNSLGEPLARDLAALGS